VEKIKEKRRKAAKYTNNMSQRQGQTTNPVHNKCRDIFFIRSRILEAIIKQEKGH